MNESISQACFRIFCFKDRGIVRNVPGGIEFHTNIRPIIDQGITIYKWSGPFIKNVIDEASGQETITCADRDVGPSFLCASRLGNLVKKTYDDWFNNNNAYVAIDKGTYILFLQKFSDQITFTCPKDRISISEKHVDTCDEKRLIIGVIKTPDGVYNFNEVLPNHMEDNTSFMDKVLKLL